MISLVIVHWNTPEALKVQIEKLLFTNSKNNKRKENIEIILVDNSSTRTKILKSSLKLLHKNKGIIIRNKKNLGFATACNQGAQRAKGNWIMFLNPDTHITKDNVRKLVKETERECFDAVSPRARTEQYYKPLPSPFSLLVEFSPLQRFISIKNFEQRTLFGGGLLIRKAVFEKVGGWDKKFFLWFEDSDLTKRLLDSKFRIGWVSIPFAHRGGISFERLSERKRKRIFFKSMTRFGKKHFSPIGQFVVKFLSILNQR